MDKLHIFTRYAVVVCLFVLNCVKYTNIFKIIVVLFVYYKYIYYISIVIQLRVTLKNYIMKAYSRQLDKFIECKPYANSSFRETDSRTWVSYFIDNSGMIHSTTFNYSIIGASPVSISDFSSLIKKNQETKVTLN